MKFKERKIEGVYEIEYEPFVDHRGYLSKPFNKNDFRDAGLDIGIAQVIYSYTEHINTVRGMYVQKVPFAEGKIVAPINGRMFWVVVDVRKGSASYGQWDALTLSSEVPRAFFVSPGFAHGCLSLTDKVSVILIADNHHSEDHGLGFSWNDPEINIGWPLIDPQPIISKIHSAYPSFSEFRRQHEET